MTDPLTDMTLYSQCKDCHFSYWPSVTFCSECGSREMTTMDLSGQGTIYSASELHSQILATMSYLTPYTLLSVDMDNNLRIYGRLKENKNSTSLIGKRVTLEKTVLYGEKKNYTTFFFSLTEP